MWTKNKTICSRRYKDDPNYLQTFLVRFKQISNETMWLVMTFLLIWLISMFCTFYEPWSLYVYNTLWYWYFLWYTWIRLACLDLLIRSYFVQILKFCSWIRAIKWLRIFISGHGKLLKFFLNMRNVLECLE